MPKKKEKPYIIRTLYCPHCDREFKGFGEQAEWNLAVHIMSKHKKKTKEVKEDDRKMERRARRNDSGTTS